METLQCTMQKTAYKFPSDFLFIAYLFNSNYEKSAILLSDGTIFLPSSPNIDKSVSTQSSFPEKGINKSKFRRVNLCNGRIGDFVELWEIIHLKI